MDPIHLHAAIRAHEVFRPVSRSLEQCIAPGDHLLVAAVSGGSDSTALALLVCAWLKERRSMPVLAYFDHAHDPTRHEAEWEHVQGLARLLGVPAARGASAMFPGIHGRGREETWRHRRYAFLSVLAGSGGLILTGHTMDDAAETFLMAAMRGGSGAAMAGPRQRWNQTIRPLLAVRREALRDLLRMVGVGWIEDPGNSEGNVRAVVRSCLLPVISGRFGSRAVEGLARSATLVEEWSEFVDSQADGAFAQVVRRSRRGAFLDLPALGDYPRAVRRRVLRRALTMCGCATTLVSSAVDDLLVLCDGNRSRRLQLPNGLEAIRSGATVRIAPPGTASPVASVPIPVPGRVAGGGWVLVASIVWPGRGHGTRLPGRKTLALLDRDEVSEPLCLRARLPGDGLVPMGMAGRVRLKKYLRDHGVPRWERWSTPIVCDASGRILWLPGIVRSRDARIGTTTKRVLVLQGIKAAMQEEERGA